MGTSKTQRTGLQRPLLRYSLSITEQRTAFVIERQQIYTKSYQTFYFVLLFRILKSRQVKIQTTSKNCQRQYTTKGLIRDLLSNTLNCYVRAGEFREYLFTGNTRQKYAKRNGIGASTIFVHVLGVISVYLCGWIIILNVDSRDPMFSCLTFPFLMKRLLIW